MNSNHLNFLLNYSDCCFYTSFKSDSLNIFFTEIEDIEIILDDNFKCLIEFTFNNKKSSTLFHYKSFLTDIFTMQDLNIDEYVTTYASDEAINYIKIILSKIHRKEKYIFKKCS